MATKMIKDAAKFIAAYIVSQEHRGMALVATESIWTECQKIQMPKSLYRLAVIELVESGLFFAHGQDDAHVLISMGKGEHLVPMVFKAGGHIGSLGTR